MGRCPVLDATAGIRLVQVVLDLSVTGREYGNLGLEFAEVRSVTASKWKW